MPEGEDYSDILRNIHGTLSSVLGITVSIARFAVCVWPPERGQLGLDRADALSIPFYVPLSSRIFIILQRWETYVNEL